LDFSFEVLFGKCLTPSLREPGRIGLPNGLSLEDLRIANEPFLEVEFDKARSGLVGRPLVDINLKD
jgi:hypothetical protein